MMGVVLEAGVDDPVVRRDEAVLVTAVEVNTVTVEEQTISKYVLSVFVLFDKMTELDLLDEQKIHVDWHQDWNQEKRRGSKYLIHWLVSND